MVWVKTLLFVAVCALGGAGVAVLVGATVGRRLLPSSAG